MSKVVTELYTLIKGEDRSIKETKSKVKTGMNNSVYSMVNIEPDMELGVLNRSRGFIKVADLGFKKPLQNLKISTDSTKQTRMTAISAGRLYDVTNFKTGAGTPILMNALLQNTGFIEMVPCVDDNLGNILALMDGVTPVNYYNYTEVKQLATHTASCGVFCQDRLWTDNIDKPSMVKWSKIGDTKDFEATDNAGYLYLGLNNTQINAMSTLLVPGKNETQVVCAKGNEIIAVSGTSGLSSDADRYRQNILTSESMGTSSPKGMVQIGQEVIVLGQDNIMSYTSLMSDAGIIKSYDLASAIRGEYKKIVNRSALDRAFTLYNSFSGRDGRLFCFIPSGISNKNNMAFVYDKMTGSWHKRDFFGFSFTCAAVDPDTQKIYLGGSDGCIYLFDEGYSYDGQEYQSFLDLGFTDFGLPSMAKTYLPDSYIEIASDDDINLKISNIKTLNGYTTPSLTGISYKPVNAIYDDNYEYDATVGNIGTPTKKFLNLKGIFDAATIQVSFTGKDKKFSIREIMLKAESKTQL